VKPIIDEGIRRIRKLGKAAGILTAVEADAKHWLELGAQFVAVGADAIILARESEKLASRFKTSPLVI
jgi:4-hydroxy-2-oxoheptanedioate aldolase